MARKKKNGGEGSEEEGAMAFPETIRAQTLDKEGKLIESAPEDLEEYEGSYTKKDGNPEESYGLKVVEDDPRSNTHHLKSEDHYWEGTELQFKEQFDEA